MIHTEIVCDHCGAVGFSESGVNRKPAHSMRTILRTVGWLIGSLSGYPSLSGKDYCPKCRVRALREASAHKTVLKRKRQFG